MTASLVVVLATGNVGKARELTGLLADNFDVRTMPGSVTLPAETGRTFAANARLKAEAVFAALGGRVAVLGDDSGLEVAALDGRPGVLSARYAGERAGDAENVGKLLLELTGRQDRQARFVCALCLVLPNDQAITSRSRLTEVEGVLDGVITMAPRGTGGFGYDPVFQPNGWEITLAQGSPASKDLVSHRGSAARALVARLTEQGLMSDGS
jgi:XTP/dITP diphosphohydrolase